MQHIKHIKNGANELSNQLLYIKYIGWHVIVNYNVRTVHLG